MSTKPAAAQNDVMDDFATCLGFVCRPENDGQPMHRTPGDAGGWTAWAVTEQIFNAWMTQHRLHATLAMAKRPLLAQILQTWFWKPCGAGPAAGVNLMVFDFCVTSGQGQAADALQRTVGASVGGDIGQRTLKAAAAFDPAALCRLLHAAQTNFYDRDPDHARNPGWFRSCDDRLEAALKMIAALAPAAAAPLSLVS